MTEANKQGKQAILGSGGAGVIQCRESQLKQGKEDIRYAQA